HNPNVISSSVLYYPKVSFVVKGKIVISVSPFFGKGSFGSFDRITHATHECFEIRNIVAVIVESIYSVFSFGSKINHSVWTYFYIFYSVEVCSSECRSIRI